MKVFLCLAVVGVSASALTVTLDDFEAWKITHGKTYAGAEHEQRKNVWFANLAKVNAHNALNETWTMAMNEYADMTEQEFASYLGLKPLKARKSGSVHKVVGEAPTAIDWRTKNAVNPVKNQGSCGSCWAFSTIFSIEGQQAIKGGNLISLSEQMVVDCVKDEVVPYDNSTCCMGCQGGLMDNAFNYIVDKQAGNVDTEASYPYKGIGGTCNYNAANKGATITGFTDIRDMSNENVPATAQDELNLKDAVANVGPISIGVDAALGWQLYGGGVMKPVLCKSDPAKMDHGVGIVGYGTDAGQDYWIVRNSWGASWGEQGYARLEMGSNACGIANSASYPNM